MKQNEKHCQKCGAEITDVKSKKCPECGAKISKPIFKKWWFWLIIGIVIIAIGAGAGSSSDNSGSGSSDSSGSSSKTYETVDLQTMFDELEANALKAEQKYQNKYISVTAKIAGFDSDGKYISIEPVNASEWNFETMLCYIKSDSQREFLLNKSKGDTVTIKGKITSIGEILGYYLNIEEIE